MLLLSYADAQEETHCFPKILPVPIVMATVLYCIVLLGRIGASNAILTVFLFLLLQWQLGKCIRTVETII